jgi:PDZ domain
MRRGVSLLATVCGVGLSAYAAIVCAQSPSASIRHDSQPADARTVVLGVVVADSASCATPGRSTDVSGLCAIRIRSGGAADRAGIRPGDLLLRVGGAEPRSPNDLLSAIRAAHVGDRISVVIQRGSTEFTVAVQFTAADVVVLPANKPAPGNEWRRLPDLPAKNPILKAELLSMRDADQRPRQPDHLDVAEMQAVDAHNLVRLKQIVRQYGWPTISMVGVEGAKAAWLLAQHADSDRVFQQTVLEMMESLAKVGEASPTDVAYLYDRTHTPQRYGTQGGCGPNGSWTPFDIEDAQAVDQRRAEVGLGSLGEYRAFVSELCKKESSAFATPGTRSK